MTNDTPRPEQSETPLSDAQLGRDHTLVSIGQRIAEWRDLCFSTERALTAAERKLREAREMFGQVQLLWAEYTSDHITVKRMHERMHEICFAQDHEAIRSLPGVER
jgi:hypothetical protein